MTIDQYHDAWDADAPMHKDDLGTDARNVPLLHAKWWRYYTSEKRRYRQLLHKYKTLYHQKYVWYNGKMLDEDRIKLGWEPQPLSIKRTADIERHIGADDDIQALMTERDDVEETLKFLEDVIKHINKRGFDVKNAIDYQRFQMGM
jgi:hypothetical protein